VVELEERLFLGRAKTLTENVLLLALKGGPKVMNSLSPVRMRSSRAVLKDSRASFTVWVCERFLTGGKVAPMRRALRGGASGSAGEV